MWEQSIHVTASVMVAFTEFTSVNNSMAALLTRPKQFYKRKAVMRNI